jgi:hypothetical protein
MSLQHLRSYKFGQTALFDYIATIAAAFAVTAWTDLPLSISTVIMFLAGFAAHDLFKVSTVSQRFMAG